MSLEFQCQCSEREAACGVRATSVLVDGVSGYVVVCDSLHNLVVVIGVIVC